TGLTRARRSAAALALDPIPASKVLSDPLEFAEFDKHNYRVYLVPADGGTPEPLDTPVGKQATDRPTWSPDGNSMMIQAGLSNDRQDAVYRVDLKTRKAVMLPGSEDLQIPWASDASYFLAGLTPDGSPLVAIHRGDADIYSLDLNLP
ncbi:MAG: hypothetical protein ACR2JB_17940, partial [Bryobacteraceae bacterium]